MGKLCNEKSRPTRLGPQSKVLEGKSENLFIEHTRKAYGSFAKSALKSFRDTQKNLDLTNHIRLSNQHQNIPEMSKILRENFALAFFRRLKFAFSSVAQG